MHADQQRAQLPGLAGPAADHHLLAGAALGLDPVSGAARAIGRVERLGDDAFEVHAAGRLQHGIAARSRSARRSGCSRHACPCGVEQLLQPRLALAQRQVAQILAVGEQQIEDEEDQVVGLALGQRRLQGGEIRRAVVVERHASPSMMQSGKPRRSLGDRLELVASSRGPCGSSASPCRPRRAAAGDSRRA